MTKNVEMYRNQTRLQHLQLNIEYSDKLKDIFNIYILFVN